MGLIVPFFLSLPFPLAQQDKDNGQLVFFLGWSVRISGTTPSPFPFHGFLNRGPKAGFSTESKSLYGSGALFSFLFLFSFSSFLHHQVKPLVFSLRDSRWNLFPFVSWKNKGLFSFFSSPFFFFTEIQLLEYVGDGTSFISSLPLSIKWAFGHFSPFLFLPSQGSGRKKGGRGLPSSFS